MRVLKSVERWCVKVSLHSKARMVHEVFHRQISQRESVVKSDLPYGEAHLRWEGEINLC